MERSALRIFQPVLNDSSRRQPKGSRFKRPATVASGFCDANQNDRLFAEDGIEQSADADRAALLDELPDQAFIDRRRAARKLEGNQLAGDGVADFEQALGPGGSEECEGVVGEAARALPAEQRGNWYTCAGRGGCTPRPQVGFWRRNSRRWEGGRS